jgi:peroxiredoxin Q/BCP
MPQVGEMAPDFEMVNDEGAVTRLSDYRGQKVVLYFYPKDFTSGCELQACAFRDSYPEITAKNAVVLGVSADDETSHREFRKALNLPFHLLVDKDFAISKAWDCFGTKTYPDGKTFTGIQRSQFIIDETGTITSAWRPVAATESRSLALQGL